MSLTAWTIRSLGALCALCALACGQPPSQSAGAPGALGDSGVWGEQGVQARLEPAQPQEHQGDHHHAVVLIADGRPAQAAWPSGQAQLLLDEPARYLSFLWDGHLRDAGVELRARGLDGRWGPWQPVEVTWSEELHHVGRAALLWPAIEVELRGLEDVSWLSAQPRAQAPTLPARLTRELPLASRMASPQAEASLGEASAPSSGLALRQQRLAPEELVISRERWGARDPGKICGDVVEPYRVSIHHTAQPDSDGADPAARMRQMQAYHIDTQGWCDIGYHFVVSQSGLIYQGRSDERRPGAHVGNQNAGNIGVSFIGNYQVAQPPKEQLEAARRLLAWMRDAYSGIPWNREAVRGHRQWPGQSTACPGDNLLALIDDLMGQAPGPEPERTYDIDLKVNLLGDALKALHRQGSSVAVQDVLVQDTLQAELIITNKSGGPLRDVKLGYSLELPFLRATSYVIQTDHPALDGQRWVLNDANDAPDNPARDAMGASGELTLYAMGDGESKRVLIDLVADRYSLGAADHPSVRAWVKSIREVYGEQAEFDQRPALNLSDQALLQSAASLDVLSPQEWRFDVGGMDTESWMTCAGVEQGLSASADQGILVIQAKGGLTCLDASPWTMMDATRFDQLVIRARAYDGPHLLGVAWAADADAWPDDWRLSALYVELPGDGQLREHVLPVSTRQDWRGALGALRVIPRLAQQAPASGQRGLVEIDAVFLQSAQDRLTSSQVEPFVTRPPEPPYAGPLPEPASGGQGVIKPGDPLTPSADGGTIAVKGCAVASGARGASGAPSASLVLLTLLASVIGLGRAKRTRHTGTR